MSREHRRPLLAFVLVTLLCTLVVGNSLTLGSPANRTLVAEVRAAVVGEPDDSVLLGGGLATQEGPGGDDVLASADPLYPFGLFTGSSDNSSDGPIADLRPPGVVSGQIVSPPAPPASGSPPAGPPVLGPTLSGESPPLTVPTVTESSPSPSTEPTPELTTDPEPSLEPEPTPEPTPEPEPALEPEPSPEPTPEPGAEPALVPVPEPEQAPEPDSVLTFADITNPDPAPVPAPEVTDLGTGEVAPKPATDGTNGTTG